jgi:sortase B
LEVIFMKKKYMLLGLLVLFLVQLFLYLQSVSAQQELEASQKAYEALADTRTEIEGNGPLPAVILEDAEAPSANSPEMVSPPIQFASNPFAPYYSINPDFAGWLTIEGTRVDYPVARGQDNAYYLEHSFKKGKSELGAIFMDYRNVGMGMDSHTVLYGHYTESGYMFGDLDKYLSRKYLDAHPEIIFTDPFTERRYRIFSVHVSPPDGSLVDVDLSGPDQDDYLAFLKAESIHEVDVELSENDRILTLVTCNYGIKDGRLFIHAVEISGDGTKP